MKTERTELKNLTKQITDGEHAQVIDDVSGKFYLLSNKNIKDGLIEIDVNDRKINEKTFNKISKRTKLDTNDVIISTVGTIGKSAVVKNKDINFDFQRSVGIIKCDKEKIIPDYLYHYLNLNLVKKRLIDSANVSIQKCIYISDLEELIIDYHKDIQYQTKVANFLNLLDEKRNLNSKINFKIENIIKKLYNYWFVQFDFPNENNLPYKKNGGKLLWNKTFNREIPYNWEVGTLKDVLNKIECGNRPKGRVRDNIEGIPSVGAENIIGIGKYNFEQEKFIPKEYFDKMKLGKVKKKDVLVYKDGLGVGKISMFQDNFPYEKCAINSHVFILRSNNKISQNYLYFWLDQKFIKDLIIRLGLTSSQPGINQEDINEIPILVPNSNLVKKFDELIESKINILFLNAKKNKFLSNFKNEILPMILSGQITLN